MLERIDQMMVLAARAVFAALVDGFASYASTMSSPTFEQRRADHRERNPER